MSIIYGEDNGKKQQQTNTMYSYLESFPKQSLQNVAQSPASLGADKAPPHSHVQWLQRN